MEGEVVWPERHPPGLFIGQPWWRRREIFLAACVFELPWQCGIVRALVWELEA